MIWVHLRKVSNEDDCQFKRFHCALICISAPLHASSAKQFAKVPLLLTSPSQGVLLSTQNVQCCMTCACSDRPHSHKGLMWNGHINCPVPRVDLCSQRVLGTNNVFFWAGVNTPCTLKHDIWHFGDLFWDVWLTGSQVCGSHNRPTCPTARIAYVEQTIELKVTPRVETCFNCWWPLVCKQFWTLQTMSHFLSRDQTRWCLSKYVVE